MRPLQRVRAWLASRHLPLLVALLGVLLSLPSLRLGLQTDDHMLVRQLDAGAPLLAFFALGPERVEEFKQRGALAWWSGELDIRFVRPLAALSHRIDHALFEDAALPMRLVNIALYGLLCALAALGYRQLLGDGALAGLAALLFAVDDAHGLTAGWISSRNSILACLFALGALLLHARARAARRIWLQLAAVACTGAALLSAELGVTALAFLAAYALVFERGSLARRALSLWPHALLALLWAAWYATLGGGARDMGWYRDAAAAPLELALQGALDMPVWLFSQLGLSVASFAVDWTPATARLVFALLLAPLLPLFLPALRAERRARFFALAMLFAIVPLWTTVPQDRVLIGAGFGGFGLIACSLLALAARTDAYARVGRHALVAVHLVLAPLLFAPMLDALTPIENGSRALAAALPRRAGGEVVVVNLPLELLTMYAWSLRGPADDAPNSVQQLYAGQSALSVVRVDARTLEVMADDGWGRSPAEHVFSSERHLRQLASAPPRLSAMEVRVVSTTPDGRPARVRFVFPTPLESPERTWLMWGHTAPVPFHPPAIGQTMRLPAVSVFTALKP